MDLQELIPLPDSKRLARITQKTFGFNVDLGKLTESKAGQIKETFVKRLVQLDHSLGARATTDKRYFEAKLVVETIDRWLSEQVVTEGAMVCKDCGCECHNPAPGCDCPHDCNNESGSHWVMKESYQPKKPVVVESELEQAEAIMAAKNVVDRIQGMIEDLGEILNEDLPPLTDTIRDQMDSTQAQSYYDAVSAAVMSGLEAMRASREAADGAARAIAGEQGAETIGAEPEVDADMDVEAPAEEPAGGDAADSASGGDEAEMGREERI